MTAALCIGSRRGSYAVVDNRNPLRFFTFFFAACLHMWRWHFSFSKTNNRKKGRRERERRNFFSRASKRQRPSIGLRELMAVYGNMKRGRMRRFSVRTLFAFVSSLVLFLCASTLFFEVCEAAPKAKGKARSRRKMGAVDKDYHLRREKCSKTVEDMPECKGNDVKRENCVLKCVSPECYEELYGSDPLEEVRSRQHTYFTPLNPLRQNILLSSHSFFLFLGGGAGALIRDYSQNSIFSILVTGRAGYE